MKPKDKLLPNRNPAKLNPVWYFLRTVLKKVFMDISIWQDDQTAKALYSSTTTTNIGSYPPQVQEHVVRLRKQGFSLGDNEVLVFEYLMSPDARHALHFQGNMGYGKTTMLRHFMEILLPKTGLDPRTIAIYLDLAAPLPDDWKNKPDPVWTRLHILICDALRPLYKGKEFKAEVWKFIEAHEPSYSTYREQIDEFREQSQDPKEIAALTASLRKLYREENAKAFTKAILMYLALCGNATVLVAIDNLDPLEPELQIEAFTLVEWLSSFDPKQYAGLKECNPTKQPGVKCILTLRPSTMDTLVKRWGQRLVESERVVPPSLHDILRRRYDYVEQLDENKELFRRLRDEPFVIGDKIYKYDDIRTTFEVMLKTLVSQHAAEVIDALANSNFRFAMIYTESFLTSGEIPDREFAPMLFQRYVSQGRILPDHIFTRAIMLGGEDVFSEGKLGPYGGFANVYYTNCGGEAYEHTVAYRLLAHLAIVPMPESGYILKGDLLPFREILFPKFNLDEVLRLWLHLGLIESPETCVHETFGQMEQLRLSTAGKYYHFSLVDTLNYVECVKDICEVGETDIYPLPLCSGVEQKLMETLKFCEFLVGREEVECRILQQAGGPQRRFEFCRYCGRFPCITHRLMTSIADSIGRIGPSLDGPTAKASAKNLQEKASALLARTEKLHKALTDMVMTQGC